MTINKKIKIPYYDIVCLRGIKKGDKVYGSPSTYTYRGQTVDEKTMILEEWERFRPSHVTAKYYNSEGNHERTGSFSINDLFYEVEAIINF